MVKVDVGNKVVDWCGETFTVLAVDTRGRTVQVDVGGVACWLPSMMFMKVESKEGQ